MTKFKRNLYSVLAFALTICVIAGLVFPQLSNFGVRATINDISLILKNGPEYTFANNAWAPQLQIATEETVVNKAYGYIKMDIKCTDIQTVLSSWSNGGKENINGTGDFTYASDKDFALYFSGTDLKVQNEYAIGVLKKEFKSALESNKDILINGDTVTLILPLSNGDKFKSTSIITGMNIMVTHGSSVANIKNKTISISNVSFVNNGDSDDSGESPDGMLKLKNGPEFTFANNAWTPQLQVATEETAVDSAQTHIELDIKCDDVDALITNWTNGSNENINGTGDFTYDSTKDFAIYFSGTDVKVQNEYAIGVRKSDFKNALENNKEKLANGETVTFKLALANGDKFNETSIITGFNMMVSHGASVSGVAGKKISISNINFIYEQDMDEGGNSGDSGDAGDSGNSGDGSDSSDNGNTGDTGNTENTSPVKSDGPLKLLDGPEYTFTKNAWAPQLQIATENTAFSKSFAYLQLDIKCNDIETVLEKWSNGGKENINGTGNFTYDSKKDFAIWFTGTDVKVQDEYAIGVTKNELNIALKANRSALANGETVTLTLPLANGDKFKETSVVTGLNIMVTHDKNATAIEGKTISISNVKLINDGSSGIVQSGVKWQENVIFSGSEGEWSNTGKVSATLGDRKIVSILANGEPNCSAGVVTENGNTYIKTTSSTHPWNPNFWIVTASSEYNLKNVGYVKMDIQITNPEAIIDAPYFSDASASCAADYSKNAYFMYFTKGSEKAGVGVGVTQANFRAALSHYLTDLKAGKWVTIELPIDDPEFFSTVEFDKICFKYGKGLVDNVTVNYDNIRFMNGKSSVEYAVSSDDNTEADSDTSSDSSEDDIVTNKELTSGDIKSTHDSIIIDFASKKIYVAEGSIVRDLHTYITLSEGFTKRIQYQGSVMSNRDKKIEGSDFDYVVLDSAKNETVFRLIPCPVDKDGKLIIPTSETDTASNVKASGVLADWQLIVIIIASMIIGSAITLLIQLIYNKKFVLLKVFKK